MAHLPTEILSMIFERCDFTTRKQLRFTSRALGDIATRNVFHTVYLALLQPSVKKTKLIAEHPTISRYVKKLIICPELLPEDDNRQSWEQRIDMRPFPRSFDGHNPVEVGIWDIGTSRPVDWTMENVRFYDYSEKEVPHAAWLALPKHNLSADELTRGYQRFNAMVKGQKMLKGDRVTDLMRYILREFISLDSVVLGSFREGRWSRVTDVFWHALRPVLLQTSEDWQWHDRDRYGVEQLSALLEAMAIEQKELTMLSFAIAPWAFAGQQDLPPDPAYLHIETMAGCFAHLKKLKFKLTYDVEILDDGAAETFAGFLREAAVLEALDMEFTVSMSRDDEDALIDFLDYLHDIHLPKLRYLKLRMTTGEESLISFLSQHSDTLERVDLRNSCLGFNLGTWGPVIQQVHAMRFVKLVELAPLYEMTDEEGGAKAVLEYRAYYSNLLKDERTRWESATYRALIEEYNSHGRLDLAYQIVTWTGPSCIKAPDIISPVVQFSVGGSIEDFVLMSMPA